MDWQDWVRVGWMKRDALTVLARALCLECARLDDVNLEENSFQVSFVLNGRMIAKSRTYFDVPYGVKFFAQGFSETFNG